MTTEGRVPRRLRIRLSATSLFLLISTLVLALVVRNVIDAASTVLGWVLAAAILSAILQPPVDALARRLPRVLAIVVVLGLVVAAGSAVAFRVFEDLSDETRRLREVAPQAAHDLEFGSKLARDFRLEERVTTWVDELPTRLRGGAVNTAATSVSAYFLTVVLTAFLLIWGPQIATGGIRLIDDDHRREQVRHVGEHAVVRGRRYLLATTAQGTVVGLLAYGLGLVVDLPAPAPLALFAGFLATLPDVGILFGFTPLLLMAAALEAGWVTASFALAASALQLVEVFVVQPRIERASVAVGPALPLIVGLIGFNVYGLGGTIFGVALLVFVTAAVDAVAEEAELEAGDVAT